MYVNAEALHVWRTKAKQTVGRFFFKRWFFLIQSDLRIKENNILASFLDILCQKYICTNPMGKKEFKMNP